jgi:cell division protein FtsW
MKFFSLKFKGDKKIWILMLLLAAISIVSVYSSTYRLIMREGNLMGVISRHVSILFLGFVVAYVIHNMSLRSYKLITPIILLLMIICLIILFISQGESHVVKRWMFNRSFQPSDVTKIAMVVYLATVLCNNFGGDPKKFLLCVIFPVVFVCALIIKAHTSNAIMIGGTSMLMIIIGTSNRKFRNMSIFVAFLAVCLYLFVPTDIGRKDTVFNRVKTWVGTSFCPETTSKTAIIAEKKITHSYEQAEIAKYAIVSGGIFNIAPGKSVYRKTLSEAHNDYIFAIIVEEYGLTGGIIVIIVYLMLFYRIIRVIKKCSKSFTALMLLGLLVMIISQTFIHIGVSVGGLPVIGQNLPMISTGGTSIIITCAAFGMILAVSRIAEEKEEN